MGTQKSRLNETDLFENQQYMLKLMYKKIIQFYALAFSVHASGSKESLARRSKADGISDNAKRLLLLLSVGVDALRPTQHFFQQQAYEIDLVQRHIDKKCHNDWSQSNPWVGFVYNCSVGNSNM